MSIQSLHDLYVEQLRDLRNGEGQFSEALPRMAEAANNGELKEALQDHIELTQGHVQRLDTILADLGVSPDGVECIAMRGLVMEGEEAIENTDASAVRDAVLIANAQRVEHFEIASYGTVAAYARELGERDAEQTLRKILCEESDADSKLTKIATGGVIFSEGINDEANTTRT